MQAFPRTKQQFTIVRCVLKLKYPADLGDGPTTDVHKQPTAAPDLTGRA
jgi:hypothetical protein